MSLRHESEVSQLGSARKVSLEIRARAIGDVTGPLLAAELGVEHEFDGFLGSQRNGRGILFHVQTVRLTKTKGQHHASATR